jgi:alkylation response protein AidB-like acyl-CoA dehydrogenase
MEFRPTPHQHEWQERARRMASESLEPRAADYDARRVFPRENFAELRREGFLQLAVPERYGGLWVDYQAYALVMDALGAGCASTTCCLAMHFGCAFHILAAGTRAQKERFMRRIVEEGTLFAVATTDATPGETGASGIVTARQVEGGYRLSGRKYFVTGAGAADAYVVGAVREALNGGALERALFVVPADRDGVRVEERWDGMGLRASSTNDVLFEDCFVADEEFLAGTDDPEPRPFLPTAGFSLGLAAWPLGAATAAFEHIRGEMRDGTTAPSRPISQEKRRLLAEMHVELQSARLLLYHAAWVADTAPERYLLPLQAARYACTRNAVAVAQRALLAAGGRGYLARHPLERILRDTLAGPLQAACHEQCLERVASELLGSGRDGTRGGHR